MGIAQLSVIAKRKGAGAPVALTLINSKAPKAERINSPAKRPAGAD
jgi:hypothetical protein